MKYIFLAIWSISMILCDAYVAREALAQDFVKSLIGWQVRLRAEYGEMYGPLPAAGSLTKMSATKGTVVEIIKEVEDASDPANKITYYELVVKSVPSGVPANHVKGDAAYRVAKSAFTDTYWEIELSANAISATRSKESLEGDVLTLRGEAIGFVDVASGNSKELKAVAGMELDVVKQESDHYLVRLASNVDTWKVCDGERICKGKIYRVAKAKLGSEYWYRRGWTYGLLVLPYKLRLVNSSERVLSGESTLGPYLGISKQLCPVSSITWLCFGGTYLFAMTAGLSVVNVTQDSLRSGSTQSTGNRPALSYGLGVVINPKDNFQAGLFFGQDRIFGAAGRDWLYEGKWWGSVSIGFNFTR